MSAYSDKILADGAVAYWRLDEASGNALSQVGNYPGTVTGGVTRSQPGALADGNTAMLFNPAGPAGGQISIPVGSYSAIGTGPATIEWWINTSTIPAAIKIIVGTTNPLSVSPGLSFFCDTTNLYFRALVAGTGAVSDLSYPMSPSLFNGIWHHILGIIRRGTPDVAELWIDGVQVRTGNIVAGTDFTATGPTYFGAWANTNDFTGSIDEVAIYPTALTPQQIAEHYALRLATVGPNIVEGLLSTGIPFNLLRSRMYALPAKTTRFESQVPVEFSNSLDGPWISVSGSKLSTGGFVRCPTADTMIICKTRR